ncbi:MAG: hypothetical protein LBJ93_00495 [Clostridiales bacterium]|jgi:hypothetical protein|nr:hypothetical protein [Clostridiales bacterium]
MSEEIEGNLEQLTIEQQKLFLIETAASALCKFGPHKSSEDTEIPIVIKFNKIFEFTDFVSNIESRAIFRSLSDCVSHIFQAAVTNPERIYQIKQQVIDGISFCYENGLIVSKAGIVENVRIYLSDEVIEEFKEEFRKLVAEIIDGIFCLKAQFEFKSDILGQQDLLVLALCENYTKRKQLLLETERLLMLQWYYTNTINLGEIIRGEAELKLRNAYEYYEYLRNCLEPLRLKFMNSKLDTKKYHQIIDDKGVELVSEEHQRFTNLKENISVLFRDVINPSKKTFENYKKKIRIDLAVEENRKEQNILLVRHNFIIQKLKEKTPCIEKFWLFNVNPTTLNIDDLMIKSLNFYIFVNDSCEKSLSAEEKFYSRIMKLVLESTYISKILQIKLSRTIEGWHRKKDNATKIMSDFIIDNLGILKSLLSESISSDTLEYISNMRSSFFSVSLNLLDKSNIFAQTSSFLTSGKFLLFSAQLLEQKSAEIKRENLLRVKNNLEPLIVNDEIIRKISISKYDIKLLNKTTKEISVFRSISETEAEKIKTRILLDLFILENEFNKFIDAFNFSEELKVKIKAYLTQKNFEGNIEFVKRIIVARNLNLNRLERFNREESFHLLDQIILNLNFFEFIIEAIPSVEKNEELHDLYFRKLGLLEIIFNISGNYDFFNDFFERYGDLIQSGIADDKIREMVRLYSDICDIGSVGVNIMFFCKKDDGNFDEEFIKFVINDKNIFIANNYNVDQIELIYDCYNKFGEDFVKLGLKENIFSQFSKNQIEILGQFYKSNKIIFEEMNIMSAFFMKNIIEFCLVCAAIQIEQGVRQIDQIINNIVFLEASILNSILTHLILFQEIQRYQTDVFNFLNVMYAISSQSNTTEISSVTAATCATLILSIISSQARQQVIQIPSVYVV